MRALAGVALLIGLGLVLSFAASHYELRLLNLSVIAAVAVVGLNFAFGLAGLISLGHAALLGFGAYALAILTTAAKWSPWAAAVPAIALTALVAAALGWPLLRLRSHYLALATLGLNVSFGIVASNWIGLTGGTDGVSGIPSLTLAGVSLSGERPFLRFALIVLAAAALAALAIARSRFGRAMVAVRDDETAAAMTGINVRGVKVAAFTLAGGYAGIAGCLFATHVNFVSPDDFGDARSITFLSMLIVGGEGTVAGAILGAVLLTFLPEWLRVLGDGYLAFFGMLMLSCLVFMPDGIVGRIGRILGQRGRPMADASPAVMAGGDAAAPAAEGARP